jgi:hypothetical protein
MQHRHPVSFGALKGNNRNHVGFKFTCIECAFDQTHATFLLKWVDDFTLDLAVA